ncbi:hypothetical protein ACFC4G_45075 [Streptomyces sp. NPDC056002]|uniref:hypothetical protein n=1 Tax=Streptomyces sp. NPDC056002 TaxID=3345675 RepID=UPI0035D8B287
MSASEHHLAIPQSGTNRRTSNSGRQDPRRAGRPGGEEARARLEATEAEFDRELCARFQPFQDRYDQARARTATPKRLTHICPGEHGHWGRICVLDDGQETSMKELHGGRNGEGRSPHQLPPTHFTDNSG